MNRTLRTRRTTRTLAAIALCVGAHAASAQTFAPWADHGGVTVSTGAAQSAAPASDNSTFAPWRTHTMLREMADATARMNEVVGSVFRPWS